MSGILAGRERGPARVLVIDDNPAIHADLRKILGGSLVPNEEFGSAANDLFGADETAAPRVDFVVDCADQGQQGLALVQAALAEGRPYAMAFVDGRMPPGWDGVETITHLWRESPDLQVVLCTAHSDYSWNEVVRRLGFSDRLVILKKPFENVEALQLATALSEKWRLRALSRAHVLNLETMVEQRTEELRSSEERFRLIAENAADLIGIVDAAGRLTYHSPSCERLLGHSRRELAEGNFFDLIDDADRPGAVVAMRTCIERRIATACEFRARHRDGRWLIFESHNGPFRSASDAVESTLFVARDIGQRRMIELQLRQAQKLESIGQLAAGVAHELNTPVQFVGDNVRFLREAFEGLRDVLAASERWLDATETGEEPAQAVKAVREAQEICDAPFLLTEVPRAIAQTLEGVERVTRIVRAMKEFSHPGSPDRELVDLNRAIETTLTVSRNEWKYVAEVVTDFSPDLPPVPAIAGELNQVLLNLIVNAAHAIGEAAGGERADRLGTITISTRCTEECAEIRIADTGPGIPDAIRDRIFEPFFTTKPVGRGTGQGLAISRSVIVDRHAGELAFERAAGGGTVFIIRLPLSIAATRRQLQGATA